MGLVQLGSAAAIPTTSEGSGVITVTSAAEQGTKGSWAECIASTAAKGLEVLVSVYPTSTGTDFQLDIGLGSGGSEVVKIADVYSERDSTTAGNAAHFTVSLEVPVGSRVAARVSNETSASALAVTISVTVMEQ